MTTQETNTGQNSRRSRPFMTFFALIGVLFTLFVVLVFAFAVYTVHSVSQSLSGFSSSLTTSSTEGKFTVPATQSHYIAGIRLKGEITSQLSSDITEKLEAAEDDKNAVGVLLEVNSPGGSVVPSQEIYDAVKKVTAVKPVVVYVREMAASGAYYSSASASKIYANRASLVGSIGVILNSFQVDKLLTSLKINSFTIKTGDLKDAGSPFRPMTQSDIDYLQKLASDTRAEFVSDVKATRSVTDSTMEFMSDGRVVLAPQAVRLGLIDAVGSEQAALDEIAKLAQQKTTPELYFYENVQPFPQIFMQKFAGFLSDALSQTLLKTFKESSLQSESLQAR